MLSLTPPNVVSSRFKRITSIRKFWKDISGKTFQMLSEKICSSIIIKSVRIRCKDKTQLLHTENFLISTTTV